jgi:hypothetical protein
MGLKSLSVIEALTTATGVLVGVGVDVVVGVLVAVGVAVRVGVLVAVGVTVGVAGATMLTVTAEAGAPAVVATFWAVLGVVAELLTRKFSTD